MFNLLEQGCRNAFNLKGLKEFYLSTFNTYISFVDDEDRIREELKDLIDDNPIEEDESESGSEAGSGNEQGEKRKKHEDDFDDRLEDEDYELLEENLGHKIERRVSQNLTFCHLH